MNVDENPKPNGAVQELVETEVTVVVNGGERKVPKGPCQTERLLEILEVEQGYLLNVQDPGDGALRPLGPGDIVEVTEEMVFITQVPCGGSA